MNKRISKIWIFAGIVPIIAGLFYGGLSLFGILPG